MLVLPVHLFSEILFFSSLCFILCIYLLIGSELSLIRELSPTMEPNVN